MGSVAISGSDTLSINNRILADFADGTCAELTYPNDIATVKTGKNSNSIYGDNATGRNAELKIRVLRASADDKFLNSLLNLQQQGLASFPLMIGQFIKKIGDGKGNITSDTYVCAGGVFTKYPMGRTNVEGETEQSTAEYTIRFANAVRAIT